MNKLYLLIIAAFVTLSVAAQKNAPKWLEKQRKAIVSITTYGTDNNKLHSGTGFFVSETGEVVSAYSLFKGASRATVMDTEGKTYPVESILGADDMYDVIKIKVSVPKKVAFLSMPQEPLTTGADAYLIPYGTGKTGTFKEGKITEVTKLKDSYGYYKVSIPLEPSMLNAPLFTANGEVFGLAQEDATGKKEFLYAVSTGYANTLTISTTDAFNTIYNSIGIKKAWNKDPEQALVALYLLGSTQAPQTYLETLNDFITTFPSEAEGYYNRASHYVYNREVLGSSPSEKANYLALASTDLDTYLRLTTKKGDALYNKAKLIYGVAVSDTTIADEKWTLKAALDVVQQAIKEEDLPVFRQLEGDIYFTMGDYQQAYDNYMKANRSESATPEGYYWAAQAKANMVGSNISDIIVLLDSAIAKTGTPPTAAAAPYLLERIDYKLQLNNFIGAVGDYDLYYNLMNGQVADAFFYYREQAKFRLGELDGALADIQEAIRLNPNSAIYYAEEASVFIRMEKYNEALESVAKALKLEPDFAASYRLQGVCYVRLKKTANACQSFNKAKELGDPVVDRLIREHCK